MPEFAGTLPQWGMFLTTIVGLAITVIKIVPAAGALLLKSKQEDINNWRAEALDLRARLETCERLCRERDDTHMSVVNALHEEIFGIRKQHLTEQISMINVILNSVDAPELRQLLRTLESVKASLRLTQMIAADEAAKEEQQS